MLVIHAEPCSEGDVKSGASCVGVCVWVCVGGCVDVRESDRRVRRSPTAPEDVDAGAGREMSAFAGPGRAACETCDTSRGGRRRWACPVLERGRGERR